MRARKALANPIVQRDQLDGTESESALGFAAALLFFSKREQFRHHRREAVIGILVAWHHNCLLVELTIRRKWTVAHRVLRKSARTVAGTLASHATRFDDCAASTSVCGNDNAIGLDRLRRGLQLPRAGQIAEKRYRGYS